MRSAGGASFSGDFMVAGQDRRRPAARDRGRRRVRQGRSTPGTRALLLSGAFGGLLGVAAARGVPAAANEYLLRQEWGEGFATAVHVAIDLATGEFEVRTAGHPPAVQFHAGSGAGQLLEAEGPVLGHDARRRRHRRTAASSIAATRCCSTPTAWSSAPAATSPSASTSCSARPRSSSSSASSGGADRLVDRVDSKSDDRALLLLHRR